MTLSYAGRALPSPAPGGLALELQPVDASADRNADGDMLIDELTLKRKVSIKWKNLTGPQAQAVLSALAANRTGELRYRDAATGREESMQAYYGAGAKADCLRFGESPEAQIYSSVTASFIEI